MVIGVQLGLSIKCIVCVLFRCWLCVLWAGHRNSVASALTRTSRVFPTRGFLKMHTGCRPWHCQRVRRDGTQSLQFRFHARCWFIPTFRDNWCSARFINQILRLRSVSLLALCTLGRSQELRGISAYQYVARFPDTSVFETSCRRVERMFFFFRNLSKNF